MTYRQRFRDLIASRRAYARDSLDWEWQTRAARKYLKMAQGLLPVIGD